MERRTKPTLESPRLRLRAVAPDDAADLVMLDADPEVRRYVGQFPPPTLEQVRMSLIPRWQAVDAQTPAVGYWVAQSLENDGFIGWFHLRPPRQDEPGVEGDLSLGYRLRRDSWGKGLASEGGARLLRYAFEQLHAPRVTASALRENVASVRVMQKLNMSLDREWLYDGHVPAVLYQITVERWGEAWRRRAAGAEQRSG